MRARGIWPDRPLTGMEVGGIIVVVALIVFCCLGMTITGAFTTPDAPVQPQHRVPVPSRSAAS